MGAADEPPEGLGVCVPEWPAAAFPPGTGAGAALPDGAPAGLAEPEVTLRLAAEALGAPAGVVAAAPASGAGAAFDAMSDPGVWAVSGTDEAALSPPDVKLCGGCPGAAAVGTRLEPPSEQAAPKRATAVQAATNAPAAPLCSFSLASFNFIVLLPPGEPAWNMATCLGEQG
ncbi:MAG TPA: hypothetical protein VG034_01320 [Acidimicrobiia bacterium]|nr:hypothetical protein [Acidimicrobiia bacterium]